MAINVNINVSTERYVPHVNNEGLTLVVFKNAVNTNSDKTVPVRVNSVADLKENFEGGTIPAFNELYSAEYLLNAGVSLLCYSIKTVGTVVQEDITNISDIENLDYKMIVVPYAFVNETTGDEDIGLLMSFAKTRDVEIYLDLEPFVKAADLGGTGGILDNIKNNSSEKLQIFKNSGLPNTATALTIPDTLTVTDFKLATPGAYAAATDFVGVPASLAAVARKALFLKEGVYWLPVAGETYGVANEFIKLLEKITTVEKEALQSNNINVLVSKVGVGNLFTSQNTMFQSAVEDNSNPLIRSHVVTELLAIKRQLRTIADKAMFAPNNAKTWTSLSLKINNLLQKLKDADAIEEYDVKIGLDITMTEADVANGLIKSRIKYLPIRLTEAIEFNVVIQQTTNKITISVDDDEIPGGE